MASRVLSVKIDDELVELLQETADHLGVSRNALARHALEGVVDPKRLRDRRQRRGLERLRACIVERDESLRDILARARQAGDLDVDGRSDTRPALAELDASIEELTTFHLGAAHDGQRLAAVNARMRARDAKVRLMVGSGMLPRAGA